MIPIQFTHLMCIIHCFLIYLHTLMCVKQSPQPILDFQQLKRNCMALSYQPCFRPSPTSAQSNLSSAF